VAAAAAAAATTTTHAYHTVVCVFIIQNKEHCFLAMVMLKGFLQLSISVRMLYISYRKGGGGAIAAASSTETLEPTQIRKASNRSREGHACYGSLYNYVQEACYKYYIYAHFGKQIRSIMLAMIVDDNQQYFRYYLILSNARSLSSNVCTEVTFFCFVYSPKKLKFSAKTKSMLKLRHYKQCQKCCQ